MAEGWSLCLQMKLAIYTLPGPASFYGGINDNPGDVKHKNKDRFHKAEFFQQSMLLDDNKINTQ